MGLAASQARFLGITLRKANCEFKSTALAQERLQLTNQMTDISQEYANALNATKLVWKNDAVAGDYGLSYSLLMMPSAANDYNPYMFSTKSGAIVLNSKYRDAAIAAGISMAGGTPSRAGRDAFLRSLGKGTETKENVIAPDTLDALVGTKDENDVITGGIAWHYSAGMGAIPKNKGVADATTLAALVADINIGQRGLDWLQIYKSNPNTYKSTLKTSEIADIQGKITETEYDGIKQQYMDNLMAAKLNYINATDLTGNAPDISAFETLAKSALAGTKTWITKNVDDSKNVKMLTVINTLPTVTDENAKLVQEVYLKFSELEQKIATASTTQEKQAYTRELAYLKEGKDKNGKYIGATDENLDPNNNKYKYPIYWAVYELDRANYLGNNDTIKWGTGSDSATGEGANDAYTININTLLQANSNSNTIGSGNQLTVVVNDVIMHDATDLQSLTVGDLLTENIVLMSKNNNSSTTAKEHISESAKALFEYIAKLFGYGQIGVGLNIDDTTNNALNSAYEMTLRKILRASNAVVDCGSGNSNSSVSQNDAYTKANIYNRICVNNSKTAALNMSNVISAFLTYYDNYLRGTDSGYVVGKSNDATESSKTFFVTDDPNYVYAATSLDSISNEEKIADFWNELYNNICAKGWRYDDMVQDSEYLESAVKDGRYSLMALNNDGYFYQMRYNEIGYMVEETDTDAIARAEVEYQRKKAEITYKEDSIDIKTKKLDAEIAELTTEMNSVQNIISKSIEKTFTMFSN